MSNLIQAADSAPMRKAIITHTRHLTSVDIIDGLGNLVARRRFKHLYSCYLFCAYKGCSYVEVV